MVRYLLSAWLALATIAALIPSCVAAEKTPQRLSKADKQFLLGLIGNPLTDPTGKQYCTVTIVARSCGGGTGEVKVAAWYQPPDDKTPASVYFTDGDWIAAPKIFKERNFLAESMALLAPPEPGKKGAKFGERFQYTWRLRSGSEASVPDLARAAWLLKLGREDLAAKIMAELNIKRSDEPEDEPPHERLVRQLKAVLAWRAYADAVHAYMQGADQEGLRHAKRLNKKYPDFTTDFGDGKGLLAELERRQQAGTLGKAAPEKPVEFDHWEKQRQVRWLIRQLDQVDARQSGQPGGVTLAEDWRVSALIAIGEPAVEQLIETIEKDWRLTRSVRFFRDFYASRTVLSVRNVAYSVVQDILKVRSFSYYETSDSFTKHRKDATTAVRRYWKKYGQMPFEDRMMDVLTDKTSSPEAMREAAINIARINGQRRLGTTFEVVKTVARRKTPPNPAIKKFKDPTAAEAVLAAMDRDLVQYAHKNRDEDALWGYGRWGAEGAYFYAVMRLGDDRIVAELRRRGDAADTLRMRRKYALAVNVFGDAEPLIALTRDFKAGKIALPVDIRDVRDWDNQPQVVELAAIVLMLGSAKTPAADAALMALADPNHPWYATAARALRELNPTQSPGKAWFAHPYCIQLLRHELDNTTRTGTVVLVNDKGQYVEQYTVRYTVDSRSGRIPNVIADPDSRRRRVERRRCDEAASKLHKLVIGLPAYHPLMKDADQRINQMRKLLDENIGRLRHVTSEERKKHNRRWGPVYIVE